MVGAPGYLPMIDLVEASVWYHLGQVARAQRAIPPEGEFAGLPGWFSGRRGLVLARCRQALGEPPGDLLKRAVDTVGEGSVRIVRDIVGLAADAHLALERARARLAQIERDHVAPDFRESFRRRNPIHRALLDAAPPSA